MLTRGILMISVLLIIRAVISADTHISQTNMYSCFSKDMELGGSEDGAFFDDLAKL